jgi:hypothetical protein
MSAEQRFNRLYAEHGRAVLAYAVARTEIRDDGDLSGLRPGTRVARWLTRE